MFQIHRFVKIIEIAGASDWQRHPINRKRIS